MQLAGCDRPLSGDYQEIAITTVQPCLGHGARTHNSRCHSSYRSGRQRLDRQRVGQMREHHPRGGGAAHQRTSDISQPLAVATADGISELLADPERGGDRLHHQADATRGTFARDAQYPESVLVAEVVDGRSARLEDQKKGTWSGGWQHRGPR